MQKSISILFRVLCCYLAFVSHCLIAADITPSEREAFLDRAKRVKERGRGFEHYMIGLSYLQGEKIDRDVEEAVRWFLRGAVMGDVYSQRCMVIAYYEGEGVPKNRVEALAWSLVVDGPSPKKDSDADPTRSELLAGLTSADTTRAEVRSKELAKLVKEGEQVALNRWKATQREIAEDDLAGYLMGAYKGDAYCQMRLGEMYNEAAGIVPWNVVEACAWWMLAEAQGNRDALRNLEGARKLDRAS